jgi:O-antigen/teichoic acid export membrane protein
MLKELIKEGGIYTIANLLTKGVSLLLIPFYSDYFTTSEYGILSVLGIAGALTAAIFSFQIYQGVGRFISEKGITLKEQQRIGSSGLFFTLISYAVFTVIALFFKDQVIEYISEEERIQDSTYYWCLATLGLNGIFYTLGVQLKFLRKTHVFSLTSFAHALLNILLILIFVLGFDYRIDSIFMASFIVSPLMILVQVFYLKKYLVFYLGKAELKKLFQYSIPLVPAAIAYLVLNFTDRLFIKDLNNSLGDVGIYDMGFKFSAIVSIIIFAFQSALAPIIFEKYKDKETPAELGRIMRLFIGVGSLGILTLSAFSYETLYVFTQEQYFGASVLMPLFYLSVFITGLGLFSGGIHIQKKTHLIPIIVITAGLINVGLNFWLIPILDLFGAALATLISTLINHVILFGVSQKYYTIIYNRSKTLLVIGVFIIFYIPVSYLSDIYPLDLLSSILIKGGLILLYLFFLVKVNFLNFDQIRKRLF